MAALSRRMTLAALAAPTVMLTTTPAPVAATAQACPVARMARQAEQALIEFAAASARSLFGGDEAFARLSAIEAQAGALRATSLEGALFQIGLAFADLLTLGEDLGVQLTDQQNAAFDQLERCLFSAGQAMLAAGVSLPEPVRSYYLAENGSDPFRPLAPASADDGRR
ncbi:hypothetical protein IAI18_07590 [Acetobacteraceae bacterium H6797]|nr:hypothetical protein [Acetobacteraceae bacterium H6797]